LLALTAILLLTVVIPPATATWVHQRRIAHARATVERLARALAGCSELTGWASGVIAGPGVKPEWSEGRSVEIAGVRDVVCGETLQADPWGNAYLMFEDPQGSVRIRSAGPNGLVETAVRDAATGGDDIGAGLPPR
jgi:hypothetical protein